MKYLALVLLVVGSLLPCRAADEMLPKTFPTREAAAQFAEKLFAGGAVDVLKVGNEEVLVVTIHGSGVPDLLVAAYRSTDSIWVRAAQIRPAGAEFHKAVVEGDSIVVVASWSGVKQLLLQFERKPKPEAFSPGSS